MLSFAPRAGHSTLPLGDGKEGKTLSEGAGSKSFFHRRMCPPKGGLIEKATLFTVSIFEKEYPMSLIEQINEGIKSKSIRNRDQIRLLLAYAEIENIAVDARAIFPM